jgi:hypothetical protein
MTGRIRCRAAWTGNGPRRAAATVATLGLMLAGASGCSSRAAVTASAAADAPAAGAPTALPAAGQAFVVCSDSAGDGGAADLLSISAVNAEQQVFLAFAFAAPMASGTATMTLLSSSPQRQIRIGLRDGKPVVVEMVTANSTATAAQPDEVVHVAGADVHVVLPDMMMPREARGWRAVITAGSARDVCAAAE